MPPKSGEATPVNLSDDEIHLWDLLREMRQKEKLSFEFIRRRNFPKASIGTIARASRGIMPKKDETRATLGLLPKVEVSVCPDCGKIHRIIETCPHRPRRQPSPRIAISKVDPESAARSIVNNVGREIIERLVERLKDELHSRTT